MRTTEERIACLHQRAEELQRRKEYRQLQLSAVLSSMMTVGLVIMTVLFVHQPSQIRPAGYAGSSLLSESTGAFVMVALGAFALGVLITVLCFRYQEVRKRNQSHDK